MAAKKRKQAAAARSMKPFYAVLGVVAVVGIGAILYTARAGAGSMATEPLNLADIGDAATLMERARGEHLGPETAPVQVLVFSDYMCPGCAHWAGQIEPFLKQEFIEQGKVRLTYYDFPLTPGHRYSFAAARAARCAADQTRFWDYHDRLFATQRQWSYSPNMPVDQFLQIGRELGLDNRTFESCVRSDAHAELVTANKMLGEQLRVGGTPTVFVNGRRLGEREWNTYEAVRAAVLEAGGV